MAPYPVPLPAPPQQPTREDPEVKAARDREALALRKQRGRMGTLLAGATYGENTPDLELPAPIGGASSGKRLLGA